MKRICKRLRIRMKTSDELKGFVTRSVAPANSFVVPFRSVQWTPPSVDSQIP